MTFLGVVFGAAYKILTPRAFSAPVVIGLSIVLDKPKYKATKQKAIKYQNAKTRHILL